MEFELKEMGKRLERIFEELQDLTNEIRGLRSRLDRLEVIVEERTSKSIKYILTKEI